MSNVVINRGALMEQDKCLAINVPFTDEQLQQLVGKDKIERHEIVTRWREEYAKNNWEIIVKKAMNLWDEDKAWLKLLREEYKKLLGKNVPVAKINDVEFIKKAIEEAKAEAKSDKE